MTQLLTPEAGEHHRTLEVNGAANPESVYRRLSRFWHELRNLGDHVGLDLEHLPPTAPDELTALAKESLLNEFSREELHRRYRLLFAANEPRELALLRHSVHQVFSVLVAHFDDTSRQLRFLEDLQCTLRGEIAAVNIELGHHEKANDQPLRSPWPGKGLVAAFGPIQVEAQLSERVYEGHTITTVGELRRYAEELTALLPNAAEQAHWAVEQLSHNIDVQMDTLRLFEELAQMP